MVELKPVRRTDRRWVRLERTAEVTLLALLALQAARLTYAAITPVGPVGRWTAPLPAPLGAPMIAGLDPFAGGPSSGPVAATTLDLVLGGVRQDRATGRGSAFLGRSGQPQQVFAVGEEVAPGVRLAGIGFDHVLLDQGGQRTQLFLDQSTPAAAAAPSAAAAPPAPALAPIPQAARELASEFQATPRIEAGTVTGYAVAPGGSGERFRALGLREGDVVVAVDGRPVASLGADDLRAGIGADSAMLEVERGGQRVNVRAR